MMMTIIMMMRFIINHNLHSAIRKSVIFSQNVDENVSCLLDVSVCCCLVAFRSSNMLVYLRDESAFRSSNMLVYLRDGSA